VYSVTLPPLPTLLVLLARPGLRALVRRSRRAGLETLLDFPRLAVLAAAVHATRHVPGDVIECGSYRGGSGGLIGQCLLGSGKTLHVCDSFIGLPPPGDKDNFHRTGDFNDTSSHAVASGLAALAVPYQVHVGFFQHTLPSLEHTTFSLVHIDVDLYDSVLECLRFTYPRLAAGGALVLDDLGSPTCLGAKAAADARSRARYVWPTPRMGFSKGAMTPECLPRFSVMLAGCSRLLGQDSLHSLEVHCDDAPRVLRHHWSTSGTTRLFRNQLGHARHQPFGHKQPIGHSGPENWRK